MRFSHLLTEKVEISFGINLERRRGRRGRMSLRMRGRKREVGQEEMDRMVYRVYRG